MISSSSPHPLRITTHSRQSSRSSLYRNPPPLLSQPSPSLPPLRPPSQMRPPTSSSPQDPTPNLEHSLLVTRNSFRPSSRSSQLSTASKSSSWLHSLPDLSSLPFSDLTTLLDTLLNLRLEYLTNDDSAESYNILQDINVKLELIKRIIVMKNRSEEEVAPEMYQTINEKIEMIDKIMAEQWVESQVVKKRFNAVAAGNTENNRYGDYERRQSCARLKQFMNGAPTPQNIPTSPPLPTPKALIAQTRYKSSYESPNHSAIKLYQIPKRHYLPNNAPLPTSNYKSQFFDYKSPTTLHPIQNPKSSHSSNFKLGLGYHKPKFRSNYRSDYVEGRGGRDDYRELDCYRDKIRTLKLMFLGRKGGLSEREVVEEIRRGRGERRVVGFGGKDNLEGGVSGLSGAGRGFQGQFLSNNKEDYKLPAIFGSNRPKFEGVERKRMEMKYRSVVGNKGEGKENAGRKGRM